MPATYEPIATTTLTSITPSVTFTSFSGYTDLILVANTRRSITGAGEASNRLTVNGDTSALYSSTLLFEAGPSSTRATGVANYDYASGSCGDGGFLLSTIHFMNYANTSVNKTIISRYGYAQTNTQTRLAVGLYRSNNAIVSFTMTPANSFDIGSIFTLYGILAA